MSPKKQPTTDALPLPAFLRLLCSSPKHPLTMSQAIKAASKLVPAGYSSPSKLQTLTQVEMVKLGIEDEEIRKGLALLTSLSAKGGKKGVKKSGREHDLDKPLPTHKVEVVVDTDLDFDEIHAEEALIKKSVITNRAPVMTAWATIVAERLGFRRQEALSIAQVFTELNATTKGVSLGIMSAPSSEGGPSSQPFVDLMGRKVPVLSTSTGEWRAISPSRAAADGVVAPPSQAFGYIQRSFRQQMGAVLGGMRVLAESFGREEINHKGYGLYVEFRPEVEKWGEKAELKVADILALRRHLTHQDGKDAVDVKEEDVGRVVKEEEVAGEGAVKRESEGERREELDEFDAALDDGDDAAFGELEAGV